jgi:hypothetical protein
VDSTKLKLKNQSIEVWLEENKSKKESFDLGICTSVFQYIESISLETIVEKMSKKTRYLYLTVPTNKELKKQIADLEFHDEYAISRSRAFYQRIMKKYFTCVSSKVWESKHFFNEETSLFSDLLYRH